MGVDSRGVYRGGCSYFGCHCIDFQRSPGTSKCYVCNHPPTIHNSDKRATPTTVSPYNTGRGGGGSHSSAPMGGHSSGESHYNQPHRHGHPSSKATDGTSGWMTCLICNTRYSPVDLGACPECCPRESCNSGCGKPAFFTVDLGSFGYCSAECRDRSELERAKRELTRALDAFEVNPGRGSTQTHVKEPAIRNAMSQSLTRPRLRSEDTPTSVTHAASPTQRPPPPQGPASVSGFSCKLSIGNIVDMSFYDSGKLQTVKATKGILVTSIEVNKATLACGIQPLDLVTHLDGKPVESLCDHFEQCSLVGKMTKSIADVWVARTPEIPHMFLLQKIEELPVYQSNRKHKIVGFLATQKDLVDPASFLGVHMDERSSRRVGLLSARSEGSKAGLQYNDIIRSVTIVTAEGVVGPDAEWSFEGIKKRARNSPSLCALMMTVVNYQ